MILDPIITCTCGHVTTVLLSLATVEYSNCNKHYMERKYYYLFLKPPKYSLTIKSKCFCRKFDSKPRLQKL